MSTMLSTSIYLPFREPHTYTDVIVKILFVQYWRGISTKHGLATFSKSSSGRSRNQPGKGKRLPGMALSRVVDVTMSWSVLAGNKEGAIYKRGWKNEGLALDNSSAQLGASEKAVMKAKASFSAVAPQRLQMFVQGIFQSKQAEGAWQEKKRWNPIVSTTCIRRTEKTETVERQGTHELQLC